MTNNSSNFQYLSNTLDALRDYIGKISDILDKQNISFWHPDSISLAEDWMATGVIIQWHPQTGSNEGQYKPELVFIWTSNQDESSQLSCIRATITHIDVNNEYTKYYEIKAPTDSHALTPEQASLIFVLLKELDKENVANWDEYF